GIAHRLILRRKMRHDMHPRRIEPDEERLAVLLGFIHEVDGEVAYFVVYRFHALRIERTGILDPLHPDLAPARHFGWIVFVGGPAMNHVTRADNVQEVLRIVGVCRVFHRVEMIEVTKELIEAMNRGQKFVPVTKMVLAELPGRIAHRLQNRCNGDGVSGYSNRSTRLTYCSHAGADW